MQLTETFSLMRTRIVALASKHIVATPQRPAIGFPTILGTGFIIDSRGVIVTNRHVAEVLRQLQPHPTTGEPAAMALVFDEVDFDGRRHGQGVTAIEIKSYFILTGFTSPNGDFYGEPIPDIALIQLVASDLSTVALAKDRGHWSIGASIATAGFAMGTNALAVYGRLNQITPFLRAGVISSVYPFPCPSPHGFTIDIMTQGGESGSPIFEADTGDVIGLLYAGFENTNITLAIPSPIVAGMVEYAFERELFDFSDIPTLAELKRRSSDREGGWELEDISGSMRPNSR